MLGFFFCWEDDCMAGNFVRGFFWGRGGGVKPHGVLNGNRCAAKVFRYGLQCGVSEGFGAWGMRAA